jgi:hypothetical protein
MARLISTAEICKTHAGTEGRINSSRGASLRQARAFHRLKAVCNFLGHAPQFIVVVETTVRVRV